MDRIKTLGRDECFVDLAVVILLCVILTSAAGLSEVTSFFTYTVAYSDRSFMIEHDFRTRQQGDSCVFPVKVLVLDSITKKPVPDVVVEIRIGLKDEGAMTNMTDKNGTTVISLILDKEGGKTCTEVLISQGYSIEASRTGYAELGIGTVS